RPGCGLRLDEGFAPPDPATLALGGRGTAGAPTGLLHRAPASPWLSSRLPPSREVMACGPSSAAAGDRLGPPPGGGHRPAVRALVLLHAREDSGGSDGQTALASWRHKGHKVSGNGPA